MLCKGFSQIISSMIIRTSGFCLLKVGTPLCVFNLILANAYALNKMKKHRKEAVAAGLYFWFSVEFLADKEVGISITDLGWCCDCVAGRSHLMEGFTWLTV